MKTWIIWDHLGGGGFQFCGHSETQVYSMEGPIVELSIVQPRMLKDTPVPYLPLFNPDSVSITIINHLDLTVLLGHIAEGLVNATGEVLINSGEEPLVS